MFLKKSTTTIKGKTYSHYKIVESYRDNGKVKHRILFPLGNLTDEQAERIRMAISAYSNPDVIVSKIDDIVVTKHLAYLDVVTLYCLWQKWQFDEFFASVRWVEAMVINRCLDPLSKIRIQEWVSSTILPALGSNKLLEVNEYDVYRGLDHLFQHEAELQEFIYQRLKQKGKFSEDVLFYDITSSYFEGSKCVLAEFGYSREHRPDRQQIVLALMITREGYPFYWQVLKGNTQDVTTVEALVDTIKERFGIKSCTLIFDRGMVSHDNLALIQEKELWYISALDRDEIKSTGILDLAMPEPVFPEDWEQVLAMREFRPYDEDGLLYYREFCYEECRYILFFDVARFLADFKARKRRLKEAHDWIEAKNQQLQQAKKTRQLPTLERQVKQMLTRKKLQKLLEVKIEPHTVTLINKRNKERTVDTFRLQAVAQPEAEREEQRLDGITCFITNLSKESCSAEEVVAYYRSKNKVEEAFHEIKAHLNLRPINLTRSQRVKAHVTVCIMAYLLLNDMEQCLKARGLKLSPANALKELKACQVSRIEVKGSDKAELKVTEPNPTQLELLKALDCEEVIGKKFVKKVLKKAQQLV